VVVQKTIWAARSGVRFAADAADSEAGSSCSAMTQHYPTASVSAAVRAGGPSFCFCYASQTLHTRALSKTLLFVLSLL